MLRADHRGARPRVDEPGRRDGRPHGRGQAAPGLRHPGAEGEPTCPGWPPASCGPRWPSPSRAAARTCRPSGPSARRDGDDYVINGAKTWITNARRSGLIALLCKTDPAAQARARGISIMLVEPGPGFTVSRDLPKLGYKGVESCELVFDDYRVPVSALLGGREGEGFAQMMRGLEIGRIQVASRALGVGRAALDDSLRYAQQREAFGEPIWKHQSIGNYLADMATKLTAARQLVMYAARCYDSGRRADMEVGHGQAVRLGDRDGDRAERGPHPRRVRVLHRVRRGALLPRRAADDRRRGHQRDPAQRHRPAADPAKPGPLASPSLRRAPAGGDRSWRWSRRSRCRSRPGSSPTSVPG